MSSFYNGYEFRNDIEHSMRLFIEGCINAYSLVECLQYFIDEFDKNNNIQNPPSETKFVVDIPDFVNEFRESTMEYINNERSKNKKCPYKKK